MSQSTTDKPEEAPVVQQQDETDEGISQEEASRRAAAAQEGGGGWPPELLHRHIEPISAMAGPSQYDDPEEWRKEQEKAAKAKK